MSRGMNPAYDHQSMVARQEYMAGGGAHPDTLLGGLTGAVQAMGLFGKMRDIMDSSQVKNRVDEMSNVMAQTGDLNSIPPEMAKGRVGAQAFANITEIFSKTKQGQAQFLESAQKVGELEFANLNAAMAQGQQYIEAGDNAGLIKTIEAASAATGMPYRHKLESDGLFQRYFTGSPDGVEKPMGDRLTAQELMTQTEAALSDQPKFQKMVMHATAANLQYNLDVQKNPDKWVRVDELDKSGKSVGHRDLIPQPNVSVGKPTSTMYYDPKDGKTYGSVEELMTADENGMRFSAPESKSGSIKSDKAALDAEKAAATQTNNEAKLGLIAEGQRIRQEASEDRVGAAGASVQIQRERLALEQEKAENSKQAQAIQRLMPLVGVRVGLQVKNGAFIEPDGEGGFRTVDDSDPRAQRALNLLDEGIAAYKDSTGKNGTPAGRGIYGAPQAMPAPNIAKNLWDSRKK